MEGRDFATLLVSESENRFIFIFVCVILVISEMFLHHVSACGYFLVIGGNTHRSMKKYKCEGRKQLHRIVLRLRCGNGDN